MKKSSLYKVLVFVLCALAISGCIPAREIHQVEPCCRPSTQGEFSLRYFYSAETVYQEIGIDQTKLAYTYFEDAEGKCDEWLFQSPCWTEEDLESKEAALSEEELNELVLLIGQSGFMDLEDSYGGTGTQRNYPYELSVKIGENEKKVAYRSSLDAPPMPEAFEKIKDKLFELVDKKF